MKKAICLILALGTLLLCGCVQAFDCSWCNQNVFEKPHNVTIFGQQAQLCDGCYDAIMALAR